MNKVVDERCDVDIAGIATLGVGKVVGLYHLFHCVNIAHDIVHLLRLQIFLLRINARPDDVARHDSLADARQFRGKGGIVLVGGVNAQEVAARHVAPCGVALFHLADVHAVLAPLDGFAENVDAAILAVHR